MRTYPRNRSQAAARIVALALLADGRLCDAELDTLQRLGAHWQLGLSADDMDTVLFDFCEDLLSTGDLPCVDSCRVDPHTLAQLLDDIDDPALRRTVLRLCVAAVEADDDVSEGELMAIVAAVEQWGLHREMMRTDPQPPMVAHG